MRPLLLLALAACATPDELASPALLADDAAPAPSGRHLVLGVSAVDLGERLSLRAEGALPGERVTFLTGASLSYPSTQCPPVLQGLCLAVSAPSAIGAAVANRQGVAAMSLPIAGLPIGRTIPFQAAVGGPDQTISQAEQRVVRATGAATPYGVGATMALPNDSSHAPDYLLGEPIAIAEPITLLGIGVDGRLVGPDARLALYADAGGQPGALIVQTAAFSLAAGAQVAPVNPTPLPVGRYWVMGIYDALASIGIDHSAPTVPVAYIALPFTSALPNRFPAPQTYTGQHFGYWLQVQ